MTTLDPLQGYIDFLSSPTCLTITAVIVIGICLKLFGIRGTASISERSGSPECVRLGLTERSNLDDQYDQKHTADKSDGKPRIKALYTYPVKSCRGVELAASEVTATGLKYDRMFTFAQAIQRSKSEGHETSVGCADEASGDSNPQWRFITQREYPRLALIETELWIPPSRAPDRIAVDSLQFRDCDQEDEDVAQDIRPASATQLSFSTERKDSWTANGGYLILRFSFEPNFNPFGVRTETVTLRLPLSPTPERARQKQYTSEHVIVWKDSLRAINVSNEITPKDFTKLKSFLGVSIPLGIFLLDPNHMRTISRSLPKVRRNKKYSVGFADAFPLHIVNLASVRAQDDELPANSRTRGSLDARRFRANIYVSGPTAYDEDTWKSIKMGRCSRAKVERSVDLYTSADSNFNMIEAEAEYHVACRTARCKVPNVDQDTGVKDVNEPLSTLNRTRKVDRGAYPHPVLGVQMIPLFERGTIRVGDEIEVLGRGEHVYEKMFA